MSLFLLALSLNIITIVKCDYAQYNLTWVVISLIILTSLVTKERLCYVYYYGIIVIIVFNHFLCLVHFLKSFQIITC